MENKTNKNSKFNISIKTFPFSPTNQVQGTNQFHLKLLLNHAKTAECMSEARQILSNVTEYSSPVDLRNASRQLFLVL